MIRHKYWPTLVPMFFLSVLTSAFTVGCADRTWGYVALGDSTPNGYGVNDSYVDYYAELIAEGQGVEVDVHNFSRNGQLTSSLLSQLRNNGELREALQEAEVITIWTGWNDLAKPLGQFNSNQCGGEDNLNCIREATAQINTNIDAIYKEILTLTSSQETVIQIADVGNPFVSAWSAKGLFDVLQGPCYEVWRDHLVEAAEELGIIVVYTYHTLNGPNGNQPVDKNIVQYDGIHFNEDGHRLLARLHHQTRSTVIP